MPIAPSENLMPQDRAIVSIKEFQAADSDVQQRLIPPLPGVYVWTHNIGRLLKADEPTIQTALTDLLSVVGRQRTSVIKPYYTVSVQDKRHTIHDKKRIRLHTLISAGGPLGEWISLLATEIQRPLYVGMALNLNQRINNHLTGNGSDLRRRLRDAEPTPVDMLDLSVSWMAAPVPKPTATSPAKEATLNETMHEAGPDPIDDLSSDDDDSRVQCDDPMYSVGSELDLTLKAAESLLIRLAMPMFNEKQD